MSSSVQDFPIDNLTVEERIVLLGRLWDSLLDSGHLPPIPAWHIQVLEQRIADADLHPESVISLDQLRSELQRNKP